MTESIRLLLIDQPTLARRCLGVYLQRRRGFDVVADAGTGADGLTLTRAHQPDMVIVEPGVQGGGVELVAELCRIIPDGAVVALTDSGGEVGAISVGETLQVGARAYLEKGCEPEDLVRAIHRVAVGKVVVSARADAMAAETTTGAVGTPSAASLTSREREVVRLVSAGMTNAEIARALCITEHTVKGYLAQMLRKLEFDNRVQLATFALQQGLGPKSDTPAPRP